MDDTFAVFRARAEWTTFLYPLSFTQVALWFQVVQIAFFSWSLMLRVASELLLYFEILN